MKAVITLLAAIVVVAGTYADTFGAGANQFSIDFVNIEHANNVADSSGYGVVDYDYRMGQKEITLDQFAKARAADSRIGNGNEGHWNSGDGITTPQVGTGGPASFVSAYEAMKFSNWLTTGDAYTGAYQFNSSGVLTAVDRDAAVSAFGMVYVLPTEDEWYKAAYYKSVNDGSYSPFANGADFPWQVTWGTTSGWNYRNENGQDVFGEPDWMWETGYGAEEQNGTHDMMGNIFEWIESANDGLLDDVAEDRVLRGGSANYDVFEMASFTRGGNSPTLEAAMVGFRVAAIPEPSSLALMTLIGGCGWVARRTLRR